MDTLFLDANILFSAAYRADSGLLKFWSLSNAELITSIYAVEEAKRNLKSREQLDRLDKLLKKIELIAIERTNNLIPANTELASKDRPILSAAIGAKATHLITGDYKDFGRYFGKKIAGIIILPPAEYFKQR